MEMTITCLQYVEMPIVSRPDCQEDYSGVNGVDEGMICAGIDEGGGFWWVLVDLGGSWWVLVGLGGTYQNICLLVSLLAPLGALVLIMV